MLRRLIKNYKDTADPHVRTSYATVAGVFGIATNLMLGILKVVIGSLTNSISIMADAVNNISDCASSGLTIAGFKLSQKKPDREHPYGHARYEYLFGFAIGIVMLMMGAIFAKDSLSKIFAPEELAINLTTYITLILAVVVKFIQMLLYSSFGKAIDSGALKASAKDSLNDMVATTGILASMVVMGFLEINIDGYVGLAISIFVMMSSIGIIREQMEPLIGIKPTPERVKMISDKLMSYPGILGLHDMVLHNYGVHNDFVSVHVEVDSKGDFVDTHELIDRIEGDFRDELGISITIHMDPVVLGNEKLDELRAQISGALQEFDPCVSFHDMRLVEGPNVTNVIFDCLVPPEKGYSSKQIASFLREKVKSNRKLSFVVEIDIPFC